MISGIVMVPVGARKSLKTAYAAAAIGIDRGDGINVGRCVAIVIISTAVNKQPAGCLLRIPTTTSLDIRSCSCMSRTTARSGGGSPRLVALLKAAEERYLRLSPRRERLSLRVFIVGQVLLRQLKLFGEDRLVFWGQLPVGALRRGRFGGGAEL